MATQRHKPEEIVAKLRQVDVLALQGQADAAEDREQGPTVHCADNLPGVNCSRCEAPADWLEPNLIKPIPQPK